MSKETQEYKKESHATCTGEALERCQTRHMNIYVKRGRYIYQKRRDMYIWQKRLMRMSKETQGYNKETVMSHVRTRVLRDVKRDICIYVSKEMYIHVKRDSHVTRTDEGLERCQKRHMYI